MASKIANFEEFLGKMPDEKVAEMADVKADTVARYRKDKKIAAFVPPGAEPEPEPKPDPEQVALAASNKGATGIDDDESDERLDRLLDLDPDDLADAVTGATRFLESQGWAVTKAGAKQEAKVPRTVRVLRTDQLHRPEGGAPMRVQRRDVHSGEIAAWLWKHHRHVVEIYPIEK